MSRTRFFAIAFALFAPLAAPAQDVAFDIAPTLDCLERTKRSAMRPACVSEAAQACVRRLPGRSPVDVSLCMEQETRYWTGRMEAALDGLDEVARARDAAFAETEMAAKVPFKLTDDLALMQAAWEDWRETRCAFEAMMYRGTPEASMQAAWCMTRVTGEYALFLESELEAAAD
jgi:uncharacterized protein YecT (DUF1311 family)